MKNNLNTSGWNHRILIHRNKDEVGYSVHEVYYDEDGKPNSCTADSCHPYGNTIEELKNEIDQFAKATTLPFLEHSFFEDLNEKARETTK